jgi:hypothetical protein
VKVANFCVVDPVKRDAAVGAVRDAQPRKVSHGRSA